MSVTDELMLRKRKRDTKAEARHAMELAYPNIVKLISGEIEDVTGLTMTLKDDGWLITLKGYMHDGTPGVRFVLGGFFLDVVFGELNRALAQKDNWKPDKFRLSSLDKSEKQ